VTGQGCWLVCRPGRVEAVSVGWAGRGAAEAMMTRLDDPDVIAELRALLTLLAQLEALEPDASDAGLRALLAASARAEPRRRRGP
jgi:hypothetical protein